MILCHDYDDNFLSLIVLNPVFISTQGLCSLLQGVAASGSDPDLPPGFIYKVPLLNVSPPEEAARVPLAV